MPKSKMPDYETEFQRKQQDKWLDSFDAASPLGRHQLLLDALQAPKAFLSPDALGFAAATVTQMLAQSNLLPELASLADQLRQRAPQAHAMLLPALQLLDLTQALYRQESDRIPVLMQGFLAIASHLPGAQWEMMLDQLACFGYQGLAAEVAARLQQKLGPGILEIEEDLDLALENHRLFWSLQRYWLSEKQEADRKALAKGIRAALADELDVRFFLRQGESTYAEQLDQLKASLLSRDVAQALSHAQLAFARWMLEKHGLSPYLSAKIMASVFVIWTMPPLKGSLALNRLARLERDQIEEIFELYEEGDDLLDSFVFLWGMPHVYAWLQELGEIQARDAEKLFASIEACKPALYKSRNLALWSFAFVHQWPRPDYLSPEAFAAEAASFRASYTASQPLSDNPADNQLFDEDFDPLEEDIASELSEEMVEDLLRHLASLKPAEREHLLSVMALEFGPTAAEMIKGMLLEKHPELHQQAMPKPAKSAKSAAKQPARKASGKSPKKSKSPKGGKKPSR